MQMKKGAAALLLMAALLAAASAGHAAECENGVCSFRRDVVFSGGGEHDPSAGYDLTRDEEVFRYLRDHIREQGSYGKVVQGGRLRLVLDEKGSLYGASFWNLKACEDMGDHMVTLDHYRVDSLGNIFRLDIISGEYQRVR